MSHCSQEKQAVLDIPKQGKAQSPPSCSTPGPYPAHLSPVPSPTSTLKAGGSEAAGSPSAEGQVKVTKIQVPVGACCNQLTGPEPGRN